MQNPNTIERIELKYWALVPLMDERMRRQWAAAEAQAYGWGGSRAVSAATGMSPSTVRKGLAGLTARAPEPRAPLADRRRAPGAGRKRITDADPGLLEALERLVDPVTRGDPQSPLRWTCKSTTKLAEEVTRQGHPVSPSTVAHLLKTAGYSLQSNRQTKEGDAQPDRNAPFEYINRTVVAWQQRGQPVISVGTKKQELVGEFRNAGREWQPRGEPEEVRVHDFMDKTLGKAIPYGVYDLSAHQGWVSVGIDHDPARFAAPAILRWWKKMGVQRYGGANERLITADGGGSNGSRSRLWKVALQDVASALGMPIQVCHVPPGTSKWNKIEQRRFCHITQNWRGRPLVSHEVIINLMANTATARGLKIQAELDAGTYPTGIQVTDEELAAVNLKRSEFHGDWNYTVLPARKKT